MSQPIVRRTRLPGKTWERENIDDRLDIVVGRHILRWTKPLAREKFPFKDALSRGRMRWRDQLLASIRQAIKKTGAVEPWKEWERMVTFSIDRRRGYCSLHTECRECLDEDGAAMIGMACFSERYRNPKERRLYG